MRRLAIAFLLAAAALPLEAAGLKVLFLGDQGHHQPARRFAQLEQALAPREIELVYTEDLADLDPRVLAGYDALAVYANIDTLPPAGEAAILEFVRGGKGLVPIHCASFCFHNSPAWIDLVGAQFQKHGTGEFRTEIRAPDHPLMQGFDGFQSWDETYVHTRHNPRGRTVLEERVEGDHHEPWTWVRSEGRGRVFYTAWGHDERTWGHPGFHNLVERGIRFAAGGDPAVAGPYVDHPRMTRHAADLAAFEYQPATVPFYDPESREWGKAKEPLANMQAPLEPAASLAHALTPEGFRIELVASEPLLEGKPLALTFDGAGRVFVAESVDYPNELVEPGQGTGHDRIVVLADGDGDGRADTRTVFAAELSIPTSMLSLEDGEHAALVVAQAPHMLRLADTDGDGVADERKVLFGGWGTGDTHAGPSNLTWGLDGWIYGIVGYAGFDGEVGGERHRFGAGFFRFRPDGSRLEFLRSTNNNSWGLGFSEEGLLFGSTANGNPSEHMPLANRVYERVRGWSATTLGGIAGSPQMELAPRNPAAGGPGTTAAIRQVDHHGRFTAAAGHRLYTARRYPREYWNRAAFVCEPTGHIVATFQLTPRGAGFTSRMAWDLVASDDEWTAPIQADVGPDGQVWVIDWYNFIVQHNPTPAGFETGRRGAYVTPLRDKTHGRIWRVVHAADRQDRGRTSLVGADPRELVQALRDDNLFWREKAQRRIVARARTRSDGGRDLVPELVALVQDTGTDAIGLNVGAIHAIWTLANLGVLEEGADAAALAAVRGALAHPSAGVRLNAVKVLPRDETLPESIRAAGLEADRAPLVRLAVLEALSECPPLEAAAAVVVEALRDGRTLADPVLLDAATAAAAVQAAGVLPALLEPRSTARTAAVILPVVLAADDAPPPQLVTVMGRVAEHVARGGDAAQLGVILVGLADADPETAAVVVEGLARGWPKGKQAALDARAEAAIVMLVERLPPGAQGQLVTLVQHAGSDALDAHVERIAATLVGELDRAAVADAVRIAAADRLVALAPADAGVVAALLERVGGRASPELSAGLVTAASRSRAEEAPGLVLDTLGSLTPQVREAAVRAVLANRDWAAALVDRLEAGGVRLGDIPIVERTRLAEHPDRGVRDRVRKLLAAGGGLPSPDRQKVIDEILPVVAKGGDVPRGKAVFKEQCGKCHMHSGEGGRVGPELTGMAVHPAHELLIHILDPNRSVEGNYRAYTVSTDEGLVVTGLLAAESRTAIEIVDAEGKRHAIQREEIDEFTPSPNSLMPLGFEKQIKPEGFADLLAFLTARGTFLPLPLEKVATAVSTRGLFYAPQNEVERLVFPDWKPKTFQGVPFALIDPQGDTVANVIMLHGPEGYLPPQMPKRVSLPLGAPARALHILGGISGWGFPATPTGSTSLVVRLVYADGQTEEHPLVNGEHVADYIRRVDVPQSEFAFDLAGRQVRYLRVQPTRQEPIETIELVKGNDSTAPIVMAITAEAGD